jgi:hypothetical protein
MALAVSQTRQGNGAGDSFSLSFSSTPTVGHLIVVCTSVYIGDSTSGLSVSDNQGNTYTQRRYDNSIYGVRLAIYTAVASTSSGTFTVTVNPAGSSADITITLLDISGQASSFLDQVNNTTGTGTAASSGDVTPTQNNELLVATMTHGGSDRTITEESGWTLAGELEGGTGNQPISSVYKLQTTATTEDADWTIGTGSADWVGQIITIIQASGGTVYNQSVSGAISPSGALLKQDKKPISGAISPSGSLSKQGGKLLSGALSPSGLLVSVKTVLKSIGGALSFSGSLSKKTLHGIGGSIAPLGSLVKKASRAFTGAITPSGSLVITKVILKALTGALSFSGSLVKSARKGLTGSIGPSGSLVKKTFRSLVGALAPSGSLSSSKTIQKILGGVLSFSGSLTKSTFKLVQGQLSFSGTIYKSARKLLGGALSFIGSLSTLLPSAPKIHSISFIGNSRSITSIIKVRSVTFAMKLRTVTIER